MAKKKKTSSAPPPPKSKSSPPPKSKKLNSQLAIALVLIIAGIGGFLVWNSPSAEVYDLSQIGKGTNVVLQVHDPN